MSNPRVVVISMTEISTSTATGSLLRNLFSGFSPQEIFQITSSRSDDEIASQYQNRHVLQQSDSRLYLRQRLARKINVLQGNGGLERESRHSLTSFAPQLVYVRVVEGLFPYATLAREISNKFHIPIAVHVMDDYEAPLAVSTSRFERSVLRRALHWDLKQLFRVSSVNFGISQKMCKEFEFRYGSRFVCIHNGVDPDEWKDLSLGTTPPASQVKPRSCFRILMAGSIDERKDAHVIRRLAMIVDSLNSTGELDCELVLNVPKFFLPVANSIADSHANVIAQTYVPSGEYKALLLSADCLVLARNSDEITRAYTGLSFHNKLPEYLASGTPIFCVGPSWDGSVQFLKQHDAGIIIEDGSDDEIRQKIIEIAQFPERIKGISGRARQTAFNDLNLIEIRRRFEAELRQAVFGNQA